jgi:hypothetical protein
LTFGKNISAPMTTEQKAILNATSIEAARSGWRFVKCARVLASAAELLDFMDDDSRRWLFTEGTRNTSKVEALYDVLIALSRETKLLEGQGNFGDVDCGPADPLFTECALTASGEELVSKWQQNNKAEQGVAPQSATRSESNSEGGNKPQPESEARSR